MSWINPEYLPEVSGVVERFLVNPEGEVDGLILADGLEVHVPPHLDAAMRAHVHVGEVVCVRGVRPRGAEMLSAVALGGADGLMIVDEGAPEDHGKHPSPTHERIKVEAGFVRFIHGPQGETRGALLDDGSLLRWPKHESKRLVQTMEAGSRVAAEGDVRRTELGIVVEVRAIGPSVDTMRPIEEKKPHPPHHDEYPPKRSKDVRARP